MTKEKGDDKKERINRIKETVDVVIIRLFLLSVGVFMAMVTISWSINTTTNKSQSIEDAAERIGRSVDAINANNKVTAERLAKSKAEQGEQQSIPEELAVENNIIEQEKQRTASCVERMQSGDIEAYNLCIKQH